MCVLINALKEGYEFPKWEYWKYKFIIRLIIISYVDNVDSFCVGNIFEVNVSKMSLETDAFVYFSMKETVRWIN